MTTVGLNPSIDRTVQIGRFAYGGMNRVASVRDDPGGKAVNVAAVAAALGAKATCTGFLCREGAAYLASSLKAMGVETYFIKRPGRVRVNIKLVDDSGVVTEINEPGEKVDEAALSALEALIARRAESETYTVLTGSLPPGCPKSYYARLIRALSGTKSKCVLDAEGEAFTLGLAEGPYLVKPNKMELEKALGRAVSSLREAALGALELLEKGAQIAAVSLGKEGALLGCEKGVFFAPALDVPVRSTVGAGDSMVAGLLCALGAGADAAEALRMGAACAAVCVTLAGTRPADAVSVRDLLGRIHVERMNVS